MCGRFSLGADTDRLIHEFGLAEVATEHAPRFNIAPTQDVVAVVRGPDGLRMGSLRWGLVPAHATSMSGPLLINARAETVHRKPAFVESFRRRRCWVLADGFYEWIRGEDGKRLPFHIRPADGRPFAFAAIWDRWEGDPGPLASCAILTTRAAPSIARIHERMPVILGPEERDQWLEPGAPAGRLKPLLRPYDGALEVRRVSTRVNAATAEGPECLLPGETTVP